jgi:hypothetical protein
LLFLENQAKSEWARRFLDQCLSYKDSIHTQMTVCAVATRFYGGLRGSADFLGERN